MSRTDDLRRGGARERGGGGGAPFVKFGDSYAWVEGHVTGFWTGKYGEVATLTVTNASAGLEAVGKDEDGEKYRVAVETGMEANVGLNNAALEGRILESDRGKHFHVAFEGWGETKDGQNFRQFAVLEIPPDESDADRGPIYPENPARVGGGPGAPGAEKPPLEDYEESGADLPF